MNRPGFSPFPSLLITWPFLTRTATTNQPVACRAQSASFCGNADAGDIGAKEQSQRRCAWESAANGLRGRPGPADCRGHDGNWVLRTKLLQNDLICAPLRHRNAGPPSPLSPTRRA